jgi:hypothetical protein
MTMLQHFLDNKPWFEPKRFGYGSGVPIAWQGWVLLAAHVGCFLGIALVLLDQPAALVVVSILVALAPLPIYVRHTRGGWKWRTGSRD